MSKKIIPVLLALLVASIVVFAFSSKGSNDNPKSKYAKVLRNVGIILEEGHYSPKKIDDAFSKSVLEKFEENLDNDKIFFLQSDIDAFKKFETKIDDEIHGAEIKSFFEINETYQKRIDEASKIFPTLLTKPFDFTKNEIIQFDNTKLSNPKTAAEQVERWRLRVKYLVLEKFVAAQEEREKNKGKKDFKVKADSTLEREAREQVGKNYVKYFNKIKGKEAKDDIFSVFVNSITGMMDPHTDYFPPIDFRSFNESMSGTFFGIGALLKDDEGKIKISSLVSGGPAWKGGELKVEDEIIKIGQGDAEPVDVTGFEVPDAVKLIRGDKKGSTVKLTIKKADGTLKVISIIRDKIELEDTFAKSAVFTSGDKKYGYIYLPEFYVNTQDASGHKCSEDVANEIKKLKAENVSGIIMDLRNNGGGSLPEVVKMAGLFIENGPICQVKSRGDKPYTWKDQDKSVLYDGPLTVMVNEYSASASEIFAAAIQDYKRGIIVGSTSTYGKGTVQRPISLNPQSEIRDMVGENNKEDLGNVKLTIQKFYRVNGGSTQLKGVESDIVLPDIYENFKLREKDSKESLPWDEIPKSEYKTWNSNISDVIANYNKNYSSTTMSKIKTVLKDLNNLKDKEYSLNITKFKEELKHAKAYNKQLDSLFKTTKELNVKNATPDLLPADAPKDKVEKNNAWLKRLGTDVYIDETLKLMSTMVSENATAKNN